MIPKAAHYDRTMEYPEPIFNKGKYLFELQLPTYLNLIHIIIPLLKFIHDLYL